VGVNVDVFEAVLLNCAVLVLGPLVIDQTPVPVVGLFAAKVTVPPGQIDWAEPALEVVGRELTFIVVVGLVVEQPDPVETTQ
jgi:hypothetical protein